MSEQIRLLESVLGHTRQQLASSMATNAELSALLQQAQERLASLESEAPSGDTKEVDL